MHADTRADSCDNDQRQRHPNLRIFVAASAAVPFDPANSRIFVKFKDSSNAVRGETSVA